MGSFCFATFGSEKSRELKREKTAGLATPFSPDCNILFLLWSLNKPLKDLVLFQRKAGLVHV